MRGSSGDGDSIASIALFHVSYPDRKESIQWLCLGLLAP